MASVKLIEINGMVFGVRCGLVALKPKLQHRHVEIVMRLRPQHSHILRLKFLYRKREAKPAIQHHKPKHESSPRCTQAYVPVT